MKWAGFSAVMVAIAFSAGAQAQGMKGMDMKDMHKGHSMQTADAAPKADGHQATGTVTKADEAKGKVTVKHGPVASLKWPGMTMGFDVKDKALFDKLKPGAKIDFSFVQSGKSYVITQVK